MVGLRLFATPTAGVHAERNIVESRKAVGELFERIKSMKKKAEECEQLVHSISKDIRSMDVAKRNLTSTITALKRLVM